MAPPRQSLAPRPSVASGSSVARSARQSMAAPVRAGKPAFKVYEDTPASSLRNALGSAPVGMTEDELEAKVSAGTGTIDTADRWDS